MLIYLSEQCQVTMVKEGCLYELPRTMVFIFTLDSTTALNIDHELLFSTSHSSSCDGYNLAFQYNLCNINHNVPFESIMTVCPWKVSIKIVMALEMSGPHDPLESFMVTYSVVTSCYLACIVPWCFFIIHISLCKAFAIIEIGWRVWSPRDSAGQWCY